MRFDYYASTIEDDPKRVVDALGKLGHTLEPCHNLAKAYHYTDGYTVLHNQTGQACRIFMKDGQKPYAFASSDATDAFCDLVRIVDARRRADLIPVIRSILPADGPRLASRAKVERFLGDILQLVPEVHAVVGEAHGLTTRLSGGLAEWARRIDCEPFRLRVTGTAGSGKTQLAMAVYRDALAAGRRNMDIFGVAVIAFVTDPDGYKIELIQRAEGAAGGGLR
jgi:catechol 2,3-dioxygenase-like lactoylglutathione lyase family enzyme